MTPKLTDREREYMAAMSDAEDLLAVLSAGGPVPTKMQTLLRQSLGVALTIARMNMEHPEKTTTMEKWQFWEQDGKWFWSLCIPFSADHGPYDSREEAVEATLDIPLRLLYAEAARAEREDRGEEEDCGVHDLSDSPSEDTSVECPNCKSGILHFEQGEFVCGGECGEIFHDDLGPLDYEEQRKELERAELRFEGAGGRGVDLAEEVDRLRTIVGLLEWKKGRE